MTDTNVLQSILDGQKRIVENIDEIRGDIKGVKGSIRDLETTVTAAISQLETKLTTRMDKLGLQIANLEDDAPTVEEFEKLETRVTKLEIQVKN